MAPSPANTDSRYAPIVPEGEPYETIQPLLDKISRASTIKAIAFSPDGQTLASGSSDGTIRLWDVATGRERARLEGHREWVNAIAFSPDGRTLASGSADETIRLWDTATGQERARLEGHQADVKSVAFSPDGRTLASNFTGSTIRLWDTANGKELGRLEGHQQNFFVYAVAFSPDGQTLASGSSDNTIRLWDTATGQERARLEGHWSWVNAVAFSPDGRTLASGSADDTIRLWDTATGQERARLEGHRVNVNDVAFSSDGLTLASGSSDGTIHLWDTATGKERARLEGHQAAVFAVAFSPDGRTLASGSNDFTIRLWEIASGKERARLEGHREYIDALAFSPDGRTLASGSQDGTLRFFGISKTKKVAAEEAMVIVPGREDLWVACRADRQRCWRRDDGSLVVNVDWNGRVLPLLPPGKFQPLTIDLGLPETDKIAAGEVLEIGIRITNAGDARAYWIGIAAAGTGPEPAWSLEPRVLPVLESGEAVTLPVRIHPHTARLNPKSIAIQPRLVVTQAYGDPIEVPPPIRTLIEPPVLRVAEARRLASGDQQAIAVTLENHGNALPATQFRVTVPGLDPARQPAALTQESLPAGGRVTLSFGLPGDLKQKNELKVALFGQKSFSGRDTGLPLYDWEFRDLAVAPPGPGWPVYLAAAVVVLGLVTWLYYVRVYRHPLVVRLRDRPEELRDLDLVEVTAACKALNRAHSLEPVLQAGGVHRDWFDGAVRFDGLPTAEERCRLLAARLGREMEQSEKDNGQEWSIDLGPDFPLNLRQLRLCLPYPGIAAADVLNRLGAPSEVTLIVGAHAGQRQALAKQAQTRGGLLVAPSGQELTALLLAEDPVDELVRLIARHVPVTQISPYQTGAGVHKQNLFFGRGSLVAQIMGGNPANYLVVGGRQVGKSSLLKEIERRYHSDPRVACRYQVLSGRDAISRLAESLSLPRNSDLAAVLEYVRTSTGPRALFLMDEADAFVHQDRQQGYATLQRLRALSEEGRAHFIMAGFWSLYEQAALDYQSPLKNFGTVLTVGALERDACRSLAVEPMARLGIRWESEELVMRLIEQSGQRANLISIACDEALWALDKTERLICAQHLQTVLGDNRLRDALLGWADLSSDQDDNRLDRIVVYATAPFEQAFGLDELIRMLAELGFEPEPERLKRSIARLELAFVLGREGNRYFYRVPLQRQLIVADDTDLLLRRELREAQGRNSPQI